MESMTVRAFLVAQPNSSNQVLHFWLRVDNEVDQLFDSLTSFHHNGIRIAPVNIQLNGEGKMLNAEFRGVPMVEHKTFAECVNHLEINGHFGTTPASERVSHYPFMASAFMLANISKSRRRACAALIVRRTPDRPPVIISSGVNGTSMGEENLCEDNLCEVSSLNVIHAEVNAYKNLRVAESAKFDTMYITDSPCPDCLNYLWLNTDIRTLVFARNYRLTEHLVNNKGFTLIHIPEQEVVDYINASEKRMSQIIC